MDKEVTAVDRQAEEFLMILHTHNISYWLDSGTLLGLMREGSLLEGDEDIDLGVWDDEEPKIRQLCPLMRKSGYVLYTASYNGEVFKYNFIPRQKGLRKIDINIFRKHGSHAWCPMYYFKVNSQRSRPGSVQGSVLGGVKGGTRTLWKQVTARFPFHVEINAFPWRAFLNIGTWWIPVEFFQNVWYNKGLKAYVPKDWEQYLAFRYGQWQKKPREWVFYRDDGGVRDIPPPQIAGGSTRRLSR